MISRLAKFLLWMLGVLALGLVATFAGWGTITSTIQSLEISTLLLWLCLTLIARLLLGETSVLPLAVLGHHLSRAEAFAIGWLRTFGNQVLPLSGAAYYIHFLRTRLRVPWGELGAMASPQYVLSGAVVCAMGVGAVIINAGGLGAVAMILAMVYAVACIMLLLIHFRPMKMVGLMPRSMRNSLQGLTNALEQFSEAKRSSLLVLACHFGAFFARGARLWLLFWAMDMNISPQELLLIVTLAESTLLLQFTPGALGLREGAVAGGAALLGLSAPQAAGIAVADRLILVAATTLFSGAAAIWLSKSSGR